MAIFIVLFVEQPPLRFNVRILILAISSYICNLLLYLASLTSVLLKHFIGTTPLSFFRFKDVYCYLFYCFRKEFDIARMEMEQYHFVNLCSCSFGQIAFFHRFS